MENPGKETVKRDIYAQQVALLYRNVLVVVAGSFVNVLALVFVCWNEVPRQGLLLWLGGQVALSGYRLLIGRAYRKSSSTHANPDFWQRLFLSGTLASGLLWGLLAVFLFPTSLGHQIFLAFIVGGLTAAAVSTYAPIAWMAAAFVIPAGLPVVARFFMQSDEVALTMGGLALLFMALMALVNREVYRTVHQSLKLRHENQELVATLTQAKNQGEQLNRELRQEIVEREQAEKALRESEEKFRGLVENAQDGIALMTDGNIIYANPAGLKMVGYREEEVLGRQMLDYIPDTPLGKTLLKQRYEDLVADKPVPPQIEAQLLAKDGSLVEVLLSNSVVTLEEQACVIGMFVDITDRKHAEQELMQAKEAAEEANRLKDEFVSLVAHDLKSPLSSIFGLIHVLNEERGSTQSEIQREAMRTITRGGERLIKSIDDLLDLSRLQSGRLRPNQRFINMRDLVESAVPLLRHAAEEKGVTVYNRVAGNPRFYADPDLFSKVVQNLVSNAIKFCREGGEINLFLPEEHPHTLAVQDNGVGIAPTQLGKLFDNTLSNSTRGTSGESGTGLGLIFSKNILLAHGGEIWAESKPDSGSIFFASLPPAQPRILALAHDNICRNLMEDEAATLKAELFCTTEANEARAILSNGSIHLVMVESGAGNDEGAEFMRWLRSNPPAQNHPVIIALLDEGAPHAEEEAYKLGADDTVTLPTTPQVLHQTMRRFV